MELLLLLEAGDDQDAFFESTLRTCVRCAPLACEVVLPDAMGIPTADLKELLDSVVPFFRALPVTLSMNNEFYGFIIVENYISDNVIWTNLHNY